MEVLSQEVVTFGDMYCQMHDLVSCRICSRDINDVLVCECGLIHSTSGEAWALQCHHSHWFEAMWTGWNLFERMVVTLACLCHPASCFSYIVVSSNVYVFIVFQVQFEQVFESRIARCRYHIFGSLKHRQRLDEVCQGEQRFSNSKLFLHEITLVTCAASKRVCEACTCRSSTYGLASRKKLKQMILNNVVWHCVQLRCFEKRSINGNRFILNVTRPHEYKQDNSGKDLLPVATERPLKKFETK